MSGLWGDSWHFACSEATLPRALHPIRRRVAHSRGRCFAAGNGTVSFPRSCVCLESSRGSTSPKECEELIDEIKSELRPSTIATSGEFDSTYRTSSTCDLGNKNRPFLKEIDRRISDFIGIDTSYGETLQGQHYLKQQEFKAHTDYFEGNQLLEHDNGRGQRTYTFMIYLNEVEEGGETEFTRLNKTFSPAQGKALIWNNLNENGTPNENTMHQAHPVVEGEKTIW